MRTCINRQTLVKQIDFLPHDFDLSQRHYAYSYSEIHEEDFSEILNKNVEQSIIG